MQEHLKYFEYCDMCMTRNCKMFSKSWIDNTNFNLRNDKRPFEHTAL